MATNWILRAGREQFLFAYAENIIDADKFLLLYDANQSKPIYPYWKYHTFDVVNQSKPIFPYWKYNTFDIGMTDDEQSFIDFRFGKNDL